MGIGYIVGAVLVGGNGYPGVSIYAREHNSTCSVNNSNGGGGRIESDTVTNANGFYFLPVPTVGTYDVQARLGPYHKTICNQTVQHNQLKEVIFSEPFYQDTAFLQQAEQHD